MNLKKKVLIVEDHPIVCRGLSELINKQKDLEVVGIAASRPEAISFLEKLKPDLITVDISLKDSNGLELIKDMIQINSEFNILVISMFDESLYAERCIKAGAKGYIMKQKLTKDLLKAIYTVLDNKIYLSEELSSQLLITKISGKDNTDLINTLSDRELEVLILTGEGLTTQEIADKTSLGVKTIETYKNKIKEKLNLKNFNQLIKFAVEWNIQNRKE
jgi:DNA-binding NarL/FixJ family response regulator